MIHVKEVLQALAQTEPRRCLQALCSIQMTSVKGCRSLCSLHRLVPQRNRGELVVLCLTAYHEWAHQSKERALAEVYAWSRRVVGDGDRADAVALARAFRAGKELSARKAAAKLYSDSIIVLADWIRVWNKRST
jgi:hypothetical protein